mmetsp:Transcript_38905/g.40326  ORF Transcript_38905/g.40326 Transcript_38905/m.40326 type:complete len:269 (+) Transcript_38905:17-823(+)
MEQKQKEDTYSKEEYDIRFAKFLLLSQGNLNTKIKNDIKEEISTRNFNKNDSVYIEVGPGEGKLTEIFGGDFNSQILYEPNPMYNDSLKKKGYTVINSVFQSQLSSFNTKFDMIVFPHCLYYFTPEEIKEVITVLNKNKKSKDSVIAILMDTFSPLSVNETIIEFACKELNLDNKKVRKTVDHFTIVNALKELDVKYKISEVDFDLSLNSAEEIYDFHSFLLIENNLFTEFFNFDQKTRDNMELLMKDYYGKVKLPMLNQRKEVLILI